MATNVIEIEADSLEEARERFKSQVPEDLHVLSEQIISDGHPRTVKAFGETVEAAFVKAQGEIPGNADILERKELAAPELKVITIEAPDEVVARLRVPGFQDGRPLTLKSIKLVTRGNKGVLGIGKKPNQYEAEVLHQAAVEIIYKTKARIRAEIGERKAMVVAGFVEQAIRGPADCRIPIGDLLFLYNTLTEALKRRGMSNAQIIALIDHGMTGVCPECHTQSPGKGLSLLATTMGSRGSGFIFAGALGGAERLLKGICRNAHCSCRDILIFWKPEGWH